MLPAETKAACFLDLSCLKGYLRDDVVDAEMQRREKEAAERAEAEALRRMNIEPEYRDATLDNYVCRTESQAEALAAARDIVSGRILKLVLLGGNGVGKTHLASAVIRAAGGVILTAFEMGLRLRDSYNTRGGEDALLDRWTHVPCLAVDEWEKVKQTEHLAATLSYVLDKRHTRRLKTVIISNQHLRRDCPTGGCPGCFELSLNDAIISRFRQDARIVRMDGEDWRRKGARDGH